MSRDPALAAIRSSGISFEVAGRDPADSLAEAARAAGLAPSQVVKTLVVRRAEDDFVLVLVPGDRSISWPKLRAVLNVSRLSMPDARAAREATGYESGTITPFGTVRPWPVVADERVAEQLISLGSGVHGRALRAAGADVVRAVGATVADVTDPLASGP